MSNRYYESLLGSINERFDVRPPTQKPDIGRLKAAIKGVISNNNSLDSSYEKSIRKSGCPSFQYTPPAELPEKFSEKKSYDYRKSDPPLYGNGRKVAELDEAQILERLNQLLAENEFSGLNRAELAEVKELQRKVK